MYKLCIDIGNTNSKAGVFSGKKLIDNIICSKEKKHELDVLIRKYPINAIIYSATGDADEYLKILKAYTIPCFGLSSDLKLAFTNSYSTKSTLGSDRIAAVSAALSRYPNNDLLIIDAGTCITYDFIDNNAIYYGGSISPGIGLRYQSLHTFTHNLPLVQGNTTDILIANTTVDAIRSGVLMGIRAEIDGIINEYKALHPDLKIILSGGDAKYFDKNLKNNIFAFPKIVLFGLNEILDINFENNKH